MNKNFVWRSALLASLFTVSAVNVQADDKNLAILDSLGVNITEYPQVTNLPTMYITVTDSTGAAVEITSKTDDYYNATIIIVDTTGTIKQRNETVGIRLRGNSTSASSIGKMAYRLKFAKKTGLLKNPDGSNDFADLKSWTLLANAFDKTMVRNALTYELGKIFGLPFCPCYRFVDLVYNGDYRGTYQISDQVQQGKKRIDVKGKSGWVIEITRQSFVDTNSDTYFTTTGGAYCIVKNPDVDDVGETKMATYKDNMKTYMDSIHKYLDPYSAANMSSSTGYRSKVDMESALNYYLAMEVTGNYDAWISNYCYRDTTEKLKFGPLWDFDLAYGNYPNTTNILTFNINNDCVMKYIIAKAYTDPILILDLYERWKSVYDNGLVSTLHAKIDSIAGVIEQSRIKNYELGATKSQNGWTINKNAQDWLACPTYDTYEQYIDSLKAYITAHAAYIDEQFQSEYDLWMNGKYYITLDADTSAFASLYTSTETHPKKQWTMLNSLADVKINNRTFASSNWNTICLPFDAKADQIKDAMGSDFMLREFVGMADDGTTMLFAEPEDNKIIAGIPYLIKLTSGEKANPTFTNVSITQTAPCTVAYGDYAFTGTFYQTTLATDGTNLFLNSDGSLLKPTSTGSKMYGMRAFFTVPANSSAKIAGLDDDGITSIDAISGHEEISDDAVYTLSGQRISRNAARNGVFIINGKKRIVR